MKQENLIRWALAGGEMRFEVGGKELECAFDWRTGHGNEIAKTFTLVKREDFAELLEDRSASLALLNLFQQCRKGVGFHPASRALAARFDGEEFGDFQHLFYDASSFADQAHDTAAQSRACVAHGVVIQGRIDLVER